MAKALRVMYIFTSYSEQGAAVQTKVMNQIKYLNSVGVVTRGAFFTTLVSKRKNLDELIELIPVTHSGKKYFGNVARRRNLESAIDRHLSENIVAYDAVYFRYPRATRGLLNI